MPNLGMMYYDFLNYLRRLNNPKIELGSDVRIIKSTIKKNGALTINNGCRLGPYVIISPSNGKISIGNNTSINAFSMLYGPGDIYIGNNVSIAPRCSLMAFNHIFSNSDIPIKKQGVSYKGIVIEDDVWIGNGVTILDGVTVSKGSVIGAGSVVTKSIPEFSIAVGNPCKVIKKRI